MNHVERFRAVMDFRPVDRLPMWEWAMWWDKTIARWRTEGLPAHLDTVFDCHGALQNRPRMGASKPASEWGSCIPHGA